MPLTAGMRLGPYEIAAPLGEGGMGQVYRARDTRLNRDVAIKILPDAFADDPDRIARFTREAQTLAALNHPHIAQIHGIEDHQAGPGFSRAIVMERVGPDRVADDHLAGPPPPWLRPAGDDDAGRHSGFRRPTRPMPSSSAVRFPCFPSRAIRRTLRHRMANAF